MVQSSLWSGNVIQSSLCRLVFSLMPCHGCLHFHSSNHHLSSLMSCHGCLHFHSSNHHLRSGLPATTHNAPHHPCNLCLCHHSRQFILMDSWPASQWVLLRSLSIP